MTAHPRPPYDEDDDLDLRALYRTLPRTEPGPGLDAAIHGAAVRALTADRRVQRQRRLWHPGWGVAASIVLTACLFLLTDFQDPHDTGLADAPPVNADLARPPQAMPRPAPPAAAPARPDDGAALRRYAPAPQAERAAPMAPAPAQAPQARQFSAEPPAAASADQAATPPEAAAPDDETQARIDRILELLQDGQREEALQALQDLKDDQPDVALPPDLQDLLPPQ